MILDRDQITSVPDAAPVTKDAVLVVIARVRVFGGMMQLFPPFRDRTVIRIGPTVRTEHPMVRFDVT
ncbi:hypothetical protein MPTK1_4g02050 [Marchantia polymorpha subsp. ruderalis]|uniref:Uncharacterized protein n=2 Tax=Marchantia polymorpha TaxID=3197 RepID=A0AAF6B5D6_MARPO|nr:hypothetical protein MARPO_0080s0094 [Marchantia polymorpha]BBN07220.1 hypothetical protein Mp_4g02050 [Marchantia polymorpha subsp. ruderalis]|eukprot:PTQ34486.1 hypothetical protein MARPO_0080s0094 [Marchantia polymorpha]